MVRYKVKPERIEEHEALIRAVFGALGNDKPDGLRYAAYKAADGVSFVHVAFVAGAVNPLNELAEFRAFTAEIKDRCDEAPVTTEYAEVAAYGL
ncbi:MAG TPA: hypothetical protein VGM56_33500 [Byssovorax sp.]|jgi:hypothetical protein